MSVRLFGKTRQERHMDRFYQEEGSMSGEPRMVIRRSLWRGGMPAPATERGHLGNPLGYWDTNCERTVTDLGAELTLTLTGCENGAEGDRK